LKNSRENALDDAWGRLWHSSALFALKKQNYSPSGRVGKALRATPFGLARLANIFRLETYQLCGQLFMLRVD
jgi:hypothetical protein